MLVDNTPSSPQLDNANAPTTNLLEVFLGQICGDSNPLRPITLNDLLAHATESNWMLSAILVSEYIKPFEQYCKQTQACDVPLGLPKFLKLIDGVPSVLIKSSSKVEPFVKQLCGRMVSHVSQMKSLSAESPPSDPTVSALSSTLPEESSLLTGDTLLAVLCEELSLIDTLLKDLCSRSEKIMIDREIICLLKSTIIACLDLLELPLTSLKCLDGITDKLITILDHSWGSIARCVIDVRSSLHLIFARRFHNIPELCSLVERTCRHSSPTHTSHLDMIIYLSFSLPDFSVGMVKENLVQRVINTSNPTTVSTTNRTFHMNLIESVAKLIGTQNRYLYGETEWKPIQQLQFEHGLKPAKQYLQFIFQRDEFFAKDDFIDPPQTRF
ncbi:hypothetical protein BLNAU_16315 [Blattamonas nauphoetae]|uniref:Uncharacterized protein n=1 Tax=Blattamonas nauphoetae TaxID=2049346 RepID=A0ABQ9XC09_9EUKA|nr:hypothetical protein BLNAU_16315 [Blattamonas nauphoetae]